MESSSPVFSLSPFLQSENSLHHHGLILQAEGKDILHSAQTPNSSDRADPTPMSMEPRESEVPFTVDAGILQAVQASTVLPHQFIYLSATQFHTNNLDEQRIAGGSTRHLASLQKSQNIIFEYMSRHFYLPHHFLWEARRKALRLSAGRGALVLPLLPSLAVSHTYSVCEISTLQKGKCGRHSKRVQAIENSWFGAQ